MYGNCRKITEEKSNLTEVANGQYIKLKDGYGPHGERSYELIVRKKKSEKLQASKRFSEESYAPPRAYGRYRLLK